MSGNWWAAIFCSLDPFWIGASNTEIIARNAEGRIMKVSLYLLVDEGNDNILAKRVTNGRIVGGGRAWHRSQSQVSFQ